MHNQQVSLPLPHFSNASKSDNLFQNILAQYFMRDLTCESDILNAIMGVLNVFRRQTGPTLRGLPTRVLVKSLGWYFTSPTTWFNFHLGVGFPARRQGFPSWTWAGWSIARDASNRKPTGEIGISFDKPLNSALYGPLPKQSVSYEPLLTFFTVTQEGDVVPLGEQPTDTSRTCSFQSHVQPPEQPESHIIPFHEFATSTFSVTPISHFLFFWTSIAGLRVTRCPKSRRVTISGATVGCYKIKSPENIFGIFPDHLRMPIEHFFELEVSWREKQPSKLLFIIVGTCQVPSSTVDSEGQPSGPATRKYPLLLVEKLDVQQVDIYRRVEACASVTICEFQWDDAKPSRKLIALI
ncbi:hypothetical protein F4803DRAFT_71635 [Xylaria telfairii]|nr:hypothetical protein F4803DRAFT_71635 [Xylaria telfairii]